MFGLLNIHKPAGWTSRDVVNRVQRFVRPHKCGHAGTLDPMATGVLLVCVGHATRLTDILHLLPKTYVAEVTLGVTSDTDDSDGNVTPSDSSESPASQVELESELSRFVGTIEQVPPRYSAVHVDGQRAYALARRGHAPDLRPRSIQVHAIELLEYSWPRLQLQIQCGSGTYIRSIARDLGRSLRCGGLMSALERTAVGAFRLQDACSLESLDAECVSQRLIPATEAVRHVTCVDCDADTARLVATGRCISLDRSDLTHREAERPLADSLAGNPMQVAITTARFTQLLAIAERLDDGQLQPRQVFV